LEAGLRVAGRVEGATITLEGVASEAGVTKPGLMYHFPNREALMVALVDHAAAQLVRRMTALLKKDPNVATPGERYSAYITAAADGENSRAEWVLWFESSYRPELQVAWARHLEPWLELPDGIPVAQRARFHTARLAADGLWGAQASGVLAPEAGDRAQILAHITGLLHEGETS